MFKTTAIDTLKQDKKCQACWYIILSTMSGSTTLSETIESIQMLEMLQNRRIKSMLIDSKLKSRERKNTIRMGKRILSATSVHTLEIGYDVP